MSSWSETLSDEVMAVARHAFERHDHDNSGTIQVEVCACFSVFVLVPCLLRFLLASAHVPANGHAY
jgi:hypothetical protein